MNIQKAILNLVLLLVGFVVIIQLMAGFSDSLDNASDELTNDAAVWGNLVSLFTNGGVFYLIILAAVIVGLIVMAFKMFKTR